MEFNFGEFITKEYGLLIQILSYLEPRDVYNARLVCSEWRKAVDHMIDKTPLSIVYKFGEKNPMPGPTKLILPDLVIYQDAVSNDFLKPEKCKICKKNFLLCYCKLVGPETSVLVLNNCQFETPYNPELYTFWQLPAVLALSCPESIKLVVYSYDKNIPFTSQPPLTDENEIIKGVFVIGKNTSRKITQHLLNGIVLKQAATFAVGGGMTNSYFYKEGYVTDSKKPEGTLVYYLLFKGDNITAHSELITSSNQAVIEKSLAALRERAGEVPENGYRIAFIAQCVDRRSESLETLESTALRKYFPGVPQCGFPAWGEFGIRSGSSEVQEINKRVKRLKINFCHARTTSIMIVTLSKPKT